ncbi:unnamed protein product [Lota lota]
MDCPCVGLAGKNTGAILLLLGLFLSLVGSVFTVMGWLDSASGTSMDWNKLLGPIILSVGGTFMLVSVCSFGMCPCLPYRLTGERAEEEEVAEEQRAASEVRPRDPAATTTGHSFVFNGVQHPMVFQCATVAAQSNPPPYDSLTPQHHQQHQQHPVGETQAGDPVLGLHRAGPPPPCFYHQFPGENPAFTTEDGFPLGCSHALTSQTRSRVQDGQQGEEKDESTTWPPPPPAYKDIYRPA